MTNKDKIDKMEFDVYELLNRLKISYDQYTHQAAYNMEEIEDIHKEIGGIYCKNLFLRNSKGDVHYLVIVSGEKKVNTKLLAKKIGSTRLSFASEEHLMKYLQLKPGSVGPFGLINDKDHQVIVIVDQDLIDAKRISFHPNNNEKTVTIDFEGLEKYFDHIKNKVQFVNLNQ